MKKLGKFFGVLAVAVMLSLSLVACGGMSQKSIAKNLEGNGYAVTQASGEAIKEMGGTAGSMVDAEMLGKLDYMVVGTKINLTDPEGIKMVIAMGFKNKDDAKAAYDEMMAEEGDMDSIGMEAELSGKVILFGSKDCIKDAK